jgi:hypothetical protein
VGKIILLMMTKVKLLVAVTCWLLPAVSAFASKAEFLGGAEQTCNLHLASGQPYVRQYRSFRWRRDEAEVYTGVVAYYAPGSGVFLWWGMDFTPDGYARYGKTLAGPSKSGCSDDSPKTLLLEDGEWAVFLAMNSRLRILHCNLKFPSLQKAWKYVAEHPEDSASWGGGKWIALVDLDKVLGPDFFHRPESLLYDARPYMFDPLLSAKKVGSTWELHIQGTDDRAVVVLDGEFQVAQVTRPVSR